MVFARETQSALDEQTAKKLGFVSGYRFSDTLTSSKSEAPLGAEANREAGSVAANSTKLKLKHAELFLFQLLRASIFIRGFDRLGLV
jgi:hypothetical protein